MKNEQLIKNLVGIDASVGNEQFYISLYPCSTCDCGSVMFYLARGYDKNVTILNIDISDKEGLACAVKVWNHINNYGLKMSTTNFLTFLNFIFEKEIKSVSL